MEKLDYTFNSKLEHMALVKIATVLWNQGDVRNCLTSETFKTYSFGEVDIVDTDPHIGWASEDFLQPNNGERQSLMFDSRTAMYNECRTIIERKEAIREQMRAWQKIERIVIGKVLRMSLPDPQKVKVISCIKPIGLEILKWIKHHLEVDYLAIRLPSEFCWTSHGTIDRKKTAEVLIKDEKINITKRYKLACLYCLENDVKALRDEIPKGHIMFDPAFEDYVVFKDCFGYFELVYFWDCIINGRTAEMHEEYNGNTCTPFQHAFECAAEHGHKAATEYFYQKLTCVEQKESLIRITDYVIEEWCEDYRDEYGFSMKYHGDVLRFLLSLMINQQLLKEEVFKELPNLGWVLLVCCLDWPWQGFFLETARFVIEFLEKEDYYDMPYFITERIKNGFKDCNYSKLFRGFCQLIPKIHKEYLYTDSTGGMHLGLPSSFLPSLFGIKDKENISLILKDATALEKDKMIFCNEGKEICVDLACNGEWDMLEYFVTECITSQEKLIQFREEITKYASCVKGKTAEEKSLCFSCLQLLDNIIQNEDK